MKNFEGRVVALVTALAIASPIYLSHAEDSFPSHTVKMVVPYPAGGGTDLLARVLANELSRKWNQSVIVENVGGAGGNIGASQVARAAPDGYSLLFASPGPISTNQFLYKQMGYDPAQWVPISVIATAPYVLVLRKNFDGASVKDVIAHAKANPGKLTSATPGVGSVGQLATVELEMLGNIDLLQVPYKGLSPAVNDMIAGNVDMMFDMLATSLPLHEGNKVKIVAVGGTERVKALPDVPTLAEAGVTGYRAVTFFGMVAPPQTPAALADKINADITEILKRPEVVDKAHLMGMDPAPGSRQEAGKFFADEMNLWGKVIKKANLPMQ
jgi:tripartite-type tricarboxylate transporter receptor subunit TctC